MKYFGLILQFIRDTFKSKADLVTEILVLRQQLAILNMKVKRPKLSWHDRAFWIALSKFYTKWKNTLVIVQPATVVAWHNRLFKIYWTRKSRRKKRPGRPKISKEIRALIAKLTRENITLGAPIIFKELMLLGFEISESTVQRYRDRSTKPPSQTWRTFLKNHKADTIAEVIDPANIRAKTSKGDIIALGNHRVLCGDSRNEKSVNVLVGKNQIDHIFGGPPYFNQREYAQWKTNEDYIDDMQVILNNCHKIAKDGAVIVWNIASGARIDHISHNSIAMEKAGFEYLDTIAWIKAGANFDLRRSCHISTTGCYFPALQWEAVLVYKKPGSMPKMDRQGQAYMKSYQTNVWEVTQVINHKEKIGHPADCPVEIPYRSMQAYSKKEQIIFEPFGGSGTTLIAAEKAGRTAFLMKQHPVYCDVIIRRWEELTGSKAEIIEKNVA